MRTFNLTEYHTLMYDLPDKLSPLYKPILGTDLSNRILHATMQCSLMCTLHNYDGEGVLLGEQYRVHLIVWQVCLLRSAFTLPNIMLVTEQI